MVVSPYRIVSFCMCEFDSLRPRTHRPHPGKLLVAGRRHARPRRTRSTRAPHMHHTSARPQRQCRTAAGQGRFLRRGGTAGESPAAKLRRRACREEAATLRRFLVKRRCGRGSCGASYSRELDVQQPTRARASDGESHSVVCRDGVPPCSRSANRNRVLGR